MACPKNPKKFLKFFSYEGDHDWEIREIRRELGDYIYQVTLECSLCGCRTNELEQEEGMLRMGFDLKRLRTLKELRPLSKDTIDAFRLGSLALHDLGTFAVRRALLYGRVQQRASDVPDAS